MPGANGERALKLRPDDETQLRLLTDLPDLVVVIDDDGRLQWANRTAERFFGLELDGALGMSGLDLVHPEDLEFVLRSLVSIQAKEVGSPIELRLRTPSGWRLIELVGTPVPWFEEGSILLCMRDLTERRRFELAHDHDSKFRTIVQNAPVVTMLVSAEGIVESCSGALTRMLGHDSELVEGRPLADLATEKQRPAVHDALGRAAAGAHSKSPVTVTVGLRRHGGGPAVPFELSFVNLLEDPTVQGFVVSAHDVSDRTRLEAELIYQAFHDSLTGLGNRALFHDRLRQALARSRRNERQLAVLFIDLDNFKLVNDELGHAAGDAVLQMLARRMNECLRASDVIARLGGDEFGILIEDTDPEAATSTAVKILRTCRRAIDTGRACLVVHASIGITIGSPDSSLEQLLREADRAMYAAKEHGKNRYEVFSRDLSATH